MKRAELLRLVDKYVKSLLSNAPMSESLALKWKIRAEIKLLYKKGE